jgi:hypothetical protein
MSLTLAPLRALRAAPAPRRRTRGARTAVPTVTRAAAGDNKPNGPRPSLGDDELDGARKSDTAPRYPTSVPIWKIDLVRLVIETHCAPSFLGFT